MTILSRIDEAKSYTSEEFIRKPDTWHVIPEYIQVKSANEEVDSTIIKVHGREFRVYGITKAQVKAEFNQAIGQLVEATAKRTDIIRVWNRFVSQKGATEKILKIGRNIFATIREKDTYVPLRTLKFVVGEELYKKVFKATPITWKISKENAAKAAELLPNIQEKQDNYFNENEVPFMHGIPRIEKVKQAVRAYLDAHTAEIAEEDEVLLRPLEYVFDPEPFPFNRKTQIEFAESILDRVCRETRLSLHIRGVYFARS